MRRFFAILLLATLPFQFSWAAVAACCVHEEAPARAQHLGHHAHEHLADAEANADAAADAQPAASFDLDCGHCHGHCAGLPQPTAALFGGSSSLLHASAADAMAAAPAATPPDRPQWARLA